MNFDEWRKKYHCNKIINLKEELNDEYIKILNQLNIVVKNKIYTGYEFECFMVEVGSYYKDEDMSELDLQYCKSLEDTSVSKEDYSKLLEKIDSIFVKYSKFFNM